MKVYEQWRCAQIQSLYQAKLAVEDSQEWYWYSQLTLCKKWCTAHSQLFELANVGYICAKLNWTEKLSGVVWVPYRLKKKILDAQNSCYSVGSHYTLSLRKTVNASDHLNKLSAIKQQHHTLKPLSLTCSRSRSWCPMIAEAWWGYFCFKCSRKASLFLSISEGCMARISREPRAPPNVCLRGTVRLPLASPLEWAVPFGEACLRLTCSTSSGEVTFRLLLVCSEGTQR